MSVIKHTTYRTSDGFDLTFNPVEDTARTTETGTGYTVTYLTHDPDPQSPAEDADDSLFLVHYHRSFEVCRNAIVARDDVQDWYQGRTISQEDQYWIFAVSAYIHSGVQLRLGQVGFAMDTRGWDTSHIGLILASRTEFPTEIAAARAAEHLIGDWNAYLSGDVYGIVQETFDAQKRAIDQDSVWGYVGREWAARSLREDL